MTIRKIDLTDVGDTLQGTMTTVFELSDYNDGLLSTVDLASGRAEEMGGQVYRVESGDYQVTDAGVADGTVYVHLLDSGAGTATAYMSIEAGIYDPNKGGYYHTDGAKVIFKMKKNSTAYNERIRIPARGRPVINPFNDYEYWTETYTYTGDQLTSMVSQDQALNSLTFNYTYNANGFIDKVVVIIAGVTYTKQYNYNGSDVLTDIAVTAV